VIATHTRPELLRVAIAAVLDQDYPGDVECIVVYDKSEPDLTLELERPGRRVAVTTNVRSPGLCGARNSGVALATGDLIGFCDDDDEWLPSKTRLQVERLRASGADVAVTGVYLHYEGTDTARSPEHDRLTLADLAANRVASARPSTVLVSRKAFNDGIGEVDENIPGGYGEDYDWILRAAEHGPIEVVRQPLVRILVHRESFFTTKWPTIVEAIDYMLSKHAALRQSRVGLARLLGRKSFALAAMREPRAARQTAWRTIRLRPGEKRAYLALAVSLRLVSPERLLHLANAAGRGI
jgi:glycosyltransferase involved in cell wall biosynthesis